MSTVGQREKKTQQRVVKLFRDTLGYRYLGNWEEREGVDGKGNRQLQPPRKTRSRRTHRPRSFPA